MKYNKKAMITYQYLAIVIVTFFISIMAFQYFMSEHKETSYRANTAALETVKSVGGKGLQITEIYFQDSLDNNYDQTVGYGYIRAKTKPNSDKIGYSDIVINLNTEKAELQTYEFSANIDCTIKDPSNPNSIYNETNNNKFGLKNYFSTSTTTINANDIIQLCFKGPYEMSFDEQVIITVTVKNGNTFTWTEYLPSNLDEESEFLYPKRVT